MVDVMTAITIDLDQLKLLILQFVRERRQEGDDDIDLMRRLTLSDLLLWLRHKQEVTGGNQTPVRD